MQNEIANAQFSAWSPDNESRDVTIRIFQPESDPESDGGNFRCRIEMTGFSESTYAYGIDSLQALSLALVYVRKEVEKFLASGGEFLQSKGDAEPLSFLFSYYADENKAPWLKSE